MLRVLDVPCRSVSFRRSLALSHLSLGCVRRSRSAVTVASVAGLGVFGLYGCVCRSRGVCKEQGHIHRAFLRRDYYLIQLHEGELQPSIRTTNGFRDSHLSSRSSGPLSRPLYCACSPVHSEHTDLPLPSPSSDFSPAVSL